MTATMSRIWLLAPWFVRRPISALGTAIRLYSEDHCGVYAAAIAYYAIFSLVPVGLIILSVFGLVIDRERIVNFVFDQVPLKESPSVRQDVDTIVQRARDVSAAGISFGLLALVWSSTGIFSAVRRGLNATAHRQQSRPYWHGKLIDLALVPSLGLLILLSIGITASAQVAIQRTGDLGVINIDTGPAIQFTTFALPAAISFTMFFLLYRFVPSARPASREALAGAMFATILFEAAKNVVAMLLRAAAFSRDTAVYAGFSSALAFLFWMFVNATILLLGSEFSRAVAPQSARAGSAGPTRERGTLQHRERARPS